MSEINKKLSEIQRSLVAPKGQWNDFSKFKYRSCENIVEAIKPLLGDGTLILTDEIVQIGDRVYVKATATFSAGDENIAASGWAREPLSKKGMDEAQITGSTSSYARKYALNGLFAIDDTKDADSMDNRKQGKSAPTSLSPDLIAWIQGERDKGIDINDVAAKIADRATMALVQEAWK